MARRQHRRSRLVSERCFHLRVSRGTARSADGHHDDGVGAINTDVHAGLKAEAFTLAPVDVRDDSVGHRRRLEALIIRGGRALRPNGLSSQIKGVVDRRSHDHRCRRPVRHRASVQGATASLAFMAMPGLWNL